MPVEPYYWYVSANKVEALDRSTGHSFLEWVKEITVRLKTPFLEADVPLQTHADAVSHLGRVTRKIEEELDPPEYATLDGTEIPPRFFRFSGRAAHSVDTEAFWLAAASPPNALLLAGSAANVLHAGGGTPAQISPTADPIGAVKRAFQETAGGDRGAVTTPQACSYIWDEVSKTTAGMLTVPQVRGLAVFAAIMAVPPSGSASELGIERLVLGTPLFVEQV
jgi:hypothetical protein